MPTEAAGNYALALPDHDITWLRRLFERAVGGFYAVTVSAWGWQVCTGKTLDWKIEKKSAGIDKIFPSMRADIILDHSGTGCRVVIDTKFNAILTKGWYRDNSLRSGYIYQIYTYLRSQEGNGDPMNENASGILLHPSIGEMVDEVVTIQGHDIRFATVDLGAHSKEIRSQLLRFFTNKMN